MLYGFGESASKADIAAKLPDGLPAPLKSFLSKLYASRLPLWRAGATAQRVSLPHFVDVDWRVDVKAASEELSRMSLPTVLVDIKCREQPCTRGVMPSEETVSFELSKEALSTMLAGLGSIRDQLDKVG